MAGDKSHPLAGKLFQDVIMALHKFWMEQGCLLWQPYNVQVGAGTGNPATLLRVLGPEPWRVAYIEPSIRPDDGRYGENPNRLQAFYQYQVILKPDPGNPQELYLQSLAAIGIDLRQHDVRFVEDNWKSPALGAWGLGWEVWLDGQEITQFTYFQQGGGLKLDPVSVEITYGLERIVLALQGKNAAWDIQWTHDITYRDIFLQSEIEHCRYYFDVADVNSLKKIYDTYEQESQHALQEGLVIPAYDYVLKCSHLFNVLDARGAIGVTDRAGYFRRMAVMTRNIAKAYADQRQRAEYPLIENGKTWPMAIPAKASLPNGQAPASAADFVLEIGTEELPASDLDSALEQLQANAPKLFSDLRLGYERLEIFGTPRRLVIYAHQVEPSQPNEEKVIKGPPLDKAYDVAGIATPMAEGFARKQGVSVHDLRVEGNYVVASVKTKGRPALMVLQEALPGFVAGLKFVDTMRWNSSGVAFSRPIRWFVALLGNAVVPFEYAGVLSNRMSRGARAVGSPDLEISSPQAYLDTMRAQGIVLAHKERRQRIGEQVQQLAQAVKGTVKEDNALLDEVTNLVEQPTAVRGTFDQRFLELPREVLITVMRSKQRYFPVENSKTGELLPYFIAVRNGDDQHTEEVIKGNEHVLMARFYDADFFYTDDRKYKLADREARLKTITFQDKLGSLYDKMQRLQAYVQPLGQLMGLSEDDLKIASQAAALAKADQATRMVVEMTSLEGIMGRQYALLEGRSEAVAQAIFEHYLPRSAGDKLPQSAAGALLAVADRLDSLVGLFGLDLQPTASADPFALRRAALGVVQVLLNRQLDVDLREAICLVAAQQPMPVSVEQQANVLNFIAGRLRVVLLEDYALPHDVVDAVLGEQKANPFRAVQGAQQLAQWTRRMDWSTLLDAFARCVRITRDKPAYTLQPDQLAPEEAIQLYRAAKTGYDQLKASDNVEPFLQAFTAIEPAITTF